jgi:hypothetical protein
MKTKIGNLMIFKPTPILTLTTNIKSELFFFLMKKYFAFFTNNVRIKWAAPHYCIIKVELIIIMVL